MFASRRSSAAWPALFALAVAQGCSLYTEDDPAADAGLDLTDASDTPVIDAAQIPTPDAEGPCETVPEFVARFGACMQFATWEAEGLGTIATLSTTGGTCESCHNSGAGNVYLVADSAVTIDMMRLPLYETAIIRVLGDDQGCFTGFGAGTLLNPSFEAAHPVVTFEAAITQGISDFFNATYARAINTNLVCN